MSERPQGQAYSKRQILKGGLLGMAGLGASSLCGASFLGSAQAHSRMAIPDAGTFTIGFRNTHTGESFAGAYRVGDRYLPEAFAKINYVLRDFRTGEMFPIDPRTIDILCSVHYRMGASAPFDVLSGYRCPKTNAMLRSSTEGVALNSLHLTGQATDIRLPGYNTAGIRDVGVRLGAGGVGFYPKSDFVHLDSGRVRQWHGSLA